MIVANKLSAASTKGQDVMFQKRGLQTLTWHVLSSAFLTFITLMVVTGLDARADQYILLLTIILPVFITVFLDYVSGLTSYTVLLLGYLYLSSQSFQSLPVLLSMIAIGVILATAGFTFERMRRRLGQMTEQAYRDNLTGAFTRGYGETLMAKELERSASHPKTVSLLILDIDHFKKFNDTYGHQMGDYVLTQLVSVLKLNLRSTDTLIRWGGEEFCVLLPRTVEEEAFVMAERIRMRVASHSFSGVASVHVSMGLASSQEGDTVQALFKRADQMLYEAKRQGRNRVVSHHAYSQNLVQKSLPSVTRVFGHKLPKLFTATSSTEEVELN